MNTINHLKSAFVRAAMLLAVIIMTAQTARAEEVKYIDENGEEQTVDATVLTGGTGHIDLDGGWYVCNTPASENNGKGLCYDGFLAFSGDTHLILADGCKMTVENDNANGILMSHTLTIYGQSEGTGALFVNLNKTSTPDCVNANEIIINGGLMAFNCGGYGLYSRKNVVINGGTVKDEGCSVCIYASNGKIIINHGTVETQSEQWGLSTSKDDIIINGGTVIAKGKVDGIFSDKNVIINGGKVEAEASNEYVDGVRGITAKENSSITLGWTNAGDHIKSGDYKLYGDGVVKIADGQYFLIDGTSTIVGGTSGTDFSIADIAGKMLTPIEAIPTGGYKFIPFTVSDRNRKITDVHAQVYVVTGYDIAKGLVYLKPVEGNVTPKGLPMVIGHVTDGTDLPRFLAIADDDALSDDALAAVEGDMLKNFVNCDGSKTVQDYLDAVFGEGVSASEYVAYVLTGGSFKSVNVKATDVIKQDVCLLFIPKWDVLKGNSVGTTASSARIISIGGDDGTATGIEAVQATSLRSGLDGDAWHDLQGRRLSEKPARKGLYIRNGKKVVVK